MLNPDFRDMLSCLRGAGVEFIVVGAYALAAHGRPRATGGIDIWVKSSPENAQKVISALEEFGAPLSNLSAEDFTAPDLIVQLGIEPCRIDLLTGVDGLDFDDAWRNKLAITLEGLEVFILSRGDLLKNKIAAGRAKDQGDIAWLQGAAGDDA
jgi:Nucleotidyl transferase of unknown function (DUF2204)